MPDSAVRVGVLIDWQNCYRGARDAFCLNDHPGPAGQVHPLALASFLAGGNGRGRLGMLTKVRVYTGAASQERDPATYNANRRQFATWTKSDPRRLEVVRRTLSYRTAPPREKGIDVAIAIDLVRTTLFEPEHDVVVLWSADTDLLPAVELVAERAGPHAIEVATWVGPGRGPKPLSPSGFRVWQHRLSEEHYRRFRDGRNYRHN